MGGAVCTNCVLPEEDTVPLEPPPEAGLLVPPPPPRTLSDFELPRSLKGTMKLEQVPQRVNSADYLPHDELMLSSDVQFIRIPTFFALLQRKTFQPHIYVLYDLQGRRRFRKGHLKYATSLFDLEEVEDPQTLETARQSTMDKLNIQIGGRIVLLYSLHVRPTASHVVSWVIDLFKDCIDPPRSVFVLNDSFHQLCIHYPHAHVRSTYTLPGATEILYGLKLFRLYISDDRAVRANSKTLIACHDIRHVLLLGPQPPQDMDQENLNIFHIPGSQAPLTFVSYLEELCKLSETEDSVLLAAPTGNQLAVHLCLFFLVQTGFTPPEAIAHVASRLCFPDTLTLPEHISHILYSYHETVQISPDLASAHRTLQCLYQSDLENYAAPAQVEETR